MARVDRPLKTMLRILQIKTYLAYSALEFENCLVGRSPKVEKPIVESNVLADCGHLLPTGLSSLDISLHTREEIMIQGSGTMSKMSQVIPGVNNHCHSPQTALHQ